MTERTIRRSATVALACLAACLLLMVCAGLANADTATDTGTGTTTSNPAGEISAGLLELDDANLHDTPIANRLSVKDNDVDLTPDPTCANAGTAGEITLLDVDESAADDWVICIGTAQAFDIPDTGSDIIGNAQLLVGTGAGTGAYVAMSGDVAIDNTGATTIQTNSVELTTDTTGNYIASLTCGSGLSGCPSAGEGATGTITAADTSATNEIQNLFETVNAPSGTDPVADTSTDTLNLAASGIVTITGDASTDTITIGATEVDGSTTNELQSLFATIDAPSGTDPVADSTTDTLTLAAGGIVAITGDSSTDTVTISATEVDGSTSNEINTVTADSGGTTSGLAVTLAGGGIVATSRSGDTVTITGTEVDGSTTNEINTVAGDSGGNTTGLAVTLAGGAGVSTARSSDTVTVATASTEAGFLADGGTTDLTCSTSNQGKAQVMDAKPLQYCDGATSSAVRYAAFGDATGDALGVAADSVALGTDTTGNYAGSSSEGGAATTALALDANPSDCAANQFATTIAADGDLTCAAITDADVPDGITVTLAATATALAANGGNCSAGQYPLGVDASGAVESCTADDDVPEAGDYSNLTGGTGITNSPTGTINATLGTAIDTSEITDGTIAQADVDDTATLGGNPAFGASSVWFATTGLVFEGATSNTSEGLLISADVSADRTWTLPDETGTVCTSGSVCTGYAASSHAHAGEDITSGTVADARIASTLTRDTEWDTAAEINAATTDDDFMELTSSQTADWSGAKIELPNATSTTGTDCDAAGEAGRIFVDTDEATGSKVKVCAGASGWENAATATMPVYEGGTLVDSACTSLDFSSLFDVSESSGQCDIALGSTVVTTPTGDITASDLPPEVAYEDEANDFGANQQTIENLDVENAAGTTILDCNIAADGSCRYTGAYSNDDDVATKADVSARTTIFLSEWASTTALNYATRQYFRDNVRTSFVSAWARNSVPIACTTGTLNVRVTYFGGSWPSGATLRVGYVKNSTGGTIIASCTVTDVGNCTDASTTTLSQGDTVHFFAQCEGTCTDNTIALAAETALLCTAN